MTPEVTRIVNSDITWADKIRALDAMGHSRAEIQHLLGKRYQHVRNVLEGDKLARRKVFPTPPSEQNPGVAEVSASYQNIVRLELGEGGVIRLPAAVQNALGLIAGNIVIAELEADRLVILSHAANMAKIDAMMEPYRWRGGPFASDELIAERRAEAAREEVEVGEGG